MPADLQAEHKILSEQQSPRRDIHSQQPQSFLIEFRAPSL